jgi:pimeloyl-ACP methyl ester carboxylesterase
MYMFRPSGGGLRDTLPAQGIPQDWRQINWSAHLADAQIASRRLRYVDIGQGQPVFVLLHGLAASWHWWLETLPALARTGRAIAIDLPGFGHSQPSAGGVSAASATAAIAELCDALEIRRPIVFGHSMGTLLALRLAAQRPAETRGVVLIGGPILSVLRLFRSPLATIAREPRVANFLLEALTAGLPLPGWARRQIATRPGLRQMALGPYARHPKRLPPDLVWELLGGIGARGVLPALAGGFAFDVDSDLRAIKCPVLVVHGADDNLVPARDVNALRTWVPDAEILSLPDTGHWPMLERPRDVDQALERWLRSC